MSSIFNVFNRDWTIQDLMNVEAGRAQRASGCMVNFETIYHELKQETILEKFKRFFTRRKDQMNVYYVIFKFKVTSDTGNTYNVFIRTLADPMNSEYMNNRVQIYCGCPDFMYRSAWSLNNHNALFRTSKINSLLGAAIQDAPSGKAKPSVLCKHAYAALNFFVSNYKSLMRSV